GHEFTQGRPASGIGRATLDLGAGLVQELAGGFGCGVHVREHALDHLELPDRLAELFPLGRVADRHVEGTLGNANGLRGDAGARALECLHRDRETLAFLPEPVIGWDAHTIEPQAGRWRASDADLVPQAGRAEPR